MATSDRDEFPSLPRPEVQPSLMPKMRPQNGPLMPEFPPLGRPDDSIVDPGKVRLGDGFITGEFPPRK
jgi:hypothetical protein